MVSQLLVVASEAFPDLLALWADGKAFGIPAGYPHLAAQGHDRRAHHHGLGEVLLADIVREALVVTLFDAKLRTLFSSLVDYGLGARTQLLAHSASLDIEPPQAPSRPRTRSEWWTGR
jgi:hypothetical protein